VYGDFSRVLDNRLGSYSGVLAQQGRFLLDAELNEQSALLLESLRRLTIDLVGPFAGPQHRTGFGVTLMVDPAGENCNGIELTPGHYYVYGMFCHAPEPGSQIAIEPRQAPFLVYLRVWEQSVSAIQVPELIDPALALQVTDTARRAQVRWQPRVASGLPDGEDLSEWDRNRILEEFERYNTDSSRLPRMAARAHLTEDPEESPETTPVVGGYRGMENQLYRVEIHEPGSGEAATFKWSRDNGSAEFAVIRLESTEGADHKVTVDSFGRDPAAGLEVEDWVELVDDSWSPFGHPPPLLQVQSVSAATRHVTLAAVDGGSPPVAHPEDHPLLRRWDQTGSDPSSAAGIPVSLAQGRWYELEDGVQVQFDPESDHFERGDYWLVAARTAISSVLWPETQGHPLAIVPHGPQRYVAPLALVPSLGEDELVDLRTRFVPFGHEPHEVVENRREPRASDIADTAIFTTLRSPVARYQLRSVGDFESGQVFDVPEGVTGIGRGQGEDIRLNEMSVSRQHLSVIVESGRLIIDDLNSGNGTFVNGARIHGPVELRIGDTIALGSEQVQLVVDPAPAEDA
jgi:Family of unknown function (DUF6519)/FHA domain